VAQRKKRGGPAAGGHDGWFEPEIDEAATFFEGFERHARKLQVGNEQHDGNKYGVE